MTWSDYKVDALYANLKHIVIFSIYTYSTSQEYTFILKCNYSQKHVLEFYNKSLKKFKFDFSKDIFVSGTRELTKKFIVFLVENQITSLFNNFTNISYVEYVNFIMWLCTKIEPHLRYVIQDDSEPIELDVP